MAMSLSEVGIRRQSSKGRGEDDFSASACRIGLNGNHEPFSEARAPKASAYFPTGETLGLTECYQ